MSTSSGNALVDGWSEGERRRRVSRSPRVSTPGIAPHELVLLILTMGTLLALSWRAGWRDTAVLHLGTAAFLAGGIIAACSFSRNEWAEKLRNATAYLYVIWFYTAVAMITPALRTTIRDPELFRLDQYVLGETPAVVLQRVTTPSLTEVLSACYFCYHIYLHGTLLYLTLFRPVSVSRPIFTMIVTAFSFGFAGYFLVPAMGPGKTHPELFNVPLTGGPITHLNAFLVGHGNSVFDQFPSMHCCATLLMLTYDWKYARRRFYFFAPFGAGLLLATMYLRYHYFTDLVAGFILYLAIWSWVSVRLGEKAKSSVGDAPQGNLGLAMAVPPQA